MAISYNRRRTLLTEGLQALEGITLTPLKGLLRLPPPAGRRARFDEFCRQALERKAWPWFRAWPSAMTAAFDSPVPWRMRRSTMD